MPYVVPGSLLGIPKWIPPQDVDPVAGITLDISRYNVITIGLTGVAVGANGLAIRAPNVIEGQIFTLTFYNEGAAIVLVPPTPVLVFDEEFSLAFDQSAVNLTSSTFPAAPPLLVSWWQFVFSGIVGRWSNVGRSPNSFPPP